MVKTAIVILNYNGRELLGTFLPKVIAFSGEDCEVYVADNASTDDSLEYLRTTFPSLPVIILAKNFGFSKGYNEALKRIEANYYMLLNSDVEVTSGWLDPLVALLDRQPEIAACQPKILSYHEKDYFEYAGAGGGFIDYLGYPFCRGRLFDTIEKDTGQYNDVVPIFWATGASLLIRSKVFHEMGGFDEDFFAHMEEIDLCWRIQLSGKKIYYCGLSKVYHVGGGTLAAKHPHKTYLNFRNGLTMLYKNTHGPKLFWRLFIRWNLDVIAALKFLFSDSADNFLAVFRAHFHFFKRIPLNRKKKSKQIDREWVEIKEMYKYSIVWKYFFKKKRYFRELKFKNT